MARHRTARANARSGEVALTETTTDSPILPAGQLRELREIDPRLVDWVVEQTEKEAVFRRGETHRVNTFVFAERLLGQVCGLLIGAGGIVAAGYIGLAGQPWLGGVVASVALGTLAVAFVVGRTRPGPPSKKPPSDQR